MSASDLVFVRFEHLGSFAFPPLHFSAAAIAKLDLSTRLHMISAANTIARQNNSNTLNTSAREIASTPSSPDNL